MSNVEVGQRGSSTSRASESRERLRQRAKEAVAGRRYLGCRHAEMRASRTHSKMRSTLVERCRQGPSLRLRMRCTQLRHRRKTTLAGGGPADAESAAVAPKCVTMSRILRPPRVMPSRKDEGVTSTLRIEVNVGRAESAAVAPKCECHSQRSPRILPSRRPEVAEDGAVGLYQPWESPKR